MMRLRHNPPPPKTIRAEPLGWRLTGRGMEGITRRQVLRCRSSHPATRSKAQAEAAGDGRIWADGRPRTSGAESGHARVCPATNNNLPNYGINKPGGTNQRQGGHAPPPVIPAQIFHHRTGGKQ